MSNTKSPFSYEIIFTKDESPTLSLDGGEKMHSLEGALAETLYIYAPCVERAITAASPVVLSMGLGLAYNEVLTAAMALKNKKSVRIYSFEIVPQLREFFLGWLNGETTELSECYDQILALFSSKYGIDSVEIKESLSELYQNGSFQVIPELALNNPYGLKFNGILYDAFSTKSSPELWDESFLNQFIQEYCDLDFCTLSTYASTGGLKRALIANGFEFRKKKGFGMKRESTFAQLNSLY